MGNNVKLWKPLFNNNTKINNSKRLIAPNRFVPPGAHIDTQAKANKLRRVPRDSREFSREVRRVNREFPPSYNSLFGTHRCSCGISYDRKRFWIRCQATPVLDPI